MRLLSHVRLFATLWTVAHQVRPSMGFSRQEYWSGFQEIFPTRAFTPGLPHCRQTLYHLSHQGSLITQREVFLPPQMITLHTARTKQERESSKKRVKCLRGALQKRQGLGKDVPWAHLLHVAPGGEGNTCPSPPTTPGRGGVAGSALDAAAPAPGAFWKGPPAGGSWVSHPCPALGPRHVGGEEAASICSHISCILQPKRRVWGRRDPAMPWGTTQTTCLFSVGIRPDTKVRHQGASRWLPKLLQPSALTAERHLLPTPASKLSPGSQSPPHPLQSPAPPLTTQGVAGYPHSRQGTLTLFPRLTSARGSSQLQQRKPCDMQGVEDPPGGQT